MEYKKITPRINSDKRGCLFEIYSRSIFFDGAAKHMYVSRSVKGTVRGFHQQLANSQRKFVFCLSGVVADFGLNIDPLSDSYGHLEKLILDGTQGEGVFVGPKVSHAFECLSEDCMLVYICDDHYDSNDQFDINPMQPEFAGIWSDPSPKLSEKDKSGLSLEEAKCILMRLRSRELGL